MIQEGARSRNRRGTLVVVAALAVAALYALALDQGHILSIVQGSQAFDMNLIHEFVHDARHAAGFPCH
ncbi:MAG: CbtB-domain containing protein [Chloroflexi bacterium]|nr:CbtB-domain containing protein [Chloroflexota bacterium]